MFFFSFQLIYKFLDLFGVETLVIFSLGGKLEFLWFLLAANQFLRDFKLISIFGMTPVDSTCVSKPRTSSCEYFLKSTFYLVNSSISGVEIFVKARLRLWDFLITVLSAFPHDHFFEFFYCFDNLCREESTLLGVVCEESLQSFGFEFMCFGFERANEI